MVRVLDEGPGIKEDERELIFQRFWRRDRRRTGNAGLGLSIVQRIADTHAATVSVENRPTGGANFSLSFARVGYRCARLPAQTSGLAAPEISRDKRRQDVENRAAVAMGSCQRRSEK